MATATIRVCLGQRQTLPPLRTAGPPAPAAPHRPAPHRRRATEEQRVAPTQPPSLAGPALTFQAPGRKAQHPQQYLPPAEEMHGARQGAAATATAVEDNRRTATGGAPPTPAGLGGGDLRAQARLRVAISTPGGLCRRHLGVGRSASGQSRATCTGRRFGMGIFEIRAGLQQASQAISWLLAAHTAPACRVNTLHFKK